MFCRALLLLLLATPIAWAADAKFGGTVHQRHRELDDYQNHMLGEWGGARTKLANDGVTLTSTYANDLAANPIGGLRHGFANAGSFGIDALADMEKINGWCGLELYMSWVWRQGRASPVTTLETSFPFSSSSVAPPTA